MMTNDEQTIRALRQAMEAEGNSHRLGVGMADTVLDHVDAERLTPRRRRRGYLAIAAACLVVIATGAIAYAIRSSGSHAGLTAAEDSGSACDGAVVTSALPTWARGGFSRGAYVEPHITGSGGDIVGILFVNPLRAHQTPGTNNKILWVAKDPRSGPLVIRAHLEGSSRDVTRTVSGGPGPSIIDMPAPGCWKLTLMWSDHTETAALPYAP